MEVMRTRTKAASVGAVVAMLAFGSVGASAGAADPATGGSATTPHHRAVAYDETLLKEAPTISGESPLANGPADLQKPEQWIGASTLVVRARYWTSPQSVKAAYHALKTAPETRFRLSGYGLHPPGSATPHGARVDFYPRHRPRTIAADDLFMEIRRHGGGSVVAAFAEAVPYPDKPADEILPLTVRRATISRLTKPQGKRAHVSTARLTVAQTRWLARSFDRMQVQPPISYSCPAPIGTEVRYRIVFRVGGQRWTVATPFVCDYVTVKRGGQRLPDLQQSRQFAHRIKQIWHVVS